MQKLILDPDQFEFLNAISSVVTDGKDKYYYCPFIFKQVGDMLVLEQLTHSELDSTAKEMITKASLREVENLG